MTFGELFMKMNPNTIVKANGHCMWIYPDSCNGIYYAVLKEWWNKNISIDTEILNSVKPSIGNDDNYYCSKCGVKITNAIKIYDGERCMTEHPDYLKPAHKWEYCKHCGNLIDWGNATKERIKNKDD